MWNSKINLEIPRKRFESYFLDTLWASTYMFLFVLTSWHNKIYWLIIAGNFIRSSKFRNYENLNFSSKITLYFTCLNFFKQNIIYWCHVMYCLTCPQFIHAYDLRLGDILQIFHGIEITWILGNFIHNWRTCISVFNLKYMLSVAFQMKFYKNYTNFDLVLKFDIFDQLLAEKTYPNFICLI